MYYSLKKQILEIQIWKNNISSKPGLFWAKMCLILHTLQKMVHNWSHENLAQLQTQNKYTFLALVRKNKLSYSITVFNLILLNSLSFLIDTYLLIEKYGNGFAFDA